MISYLYYLLFSLATLSSPFLIHCKRFRSVVLFNLLLTAQFNVTSFFKLGLTFSFFEITLVLTVFSIFLINPKAIKNIRINNTDLIFIAFLFFSFLSVFVAQIRIFTGDLVPFSYNSENIALRSIMSLNRVIIYIPLLIVMRNYFLSYIEREELAAKFIYYLALTGIFPAIATIIQFTGIGFDLIHNNPSFAETFKIVEYKIERPVGLTNEASFFVFQLFFPFIAAFEAKKRKIISKNFFFFLIFIVLIAVIVSISRTGLAFYLFFIIYSQFRHGLSVKKSSLIVFSALLGFLVLRNLNIAGVNIIDRFVSSFVVEADLSTIERYGSTEAILRLLIDKSLLFGVGVYNYGFYAIKYLPSYANVIHYDKERSMPSFNFILQLIAEFGIPFFLIFIGFVVLFIKRSKSYFVSTWFLFLFGFALTFQVLNFAVPFLIILYIPIFNEKNSIYN